MNEKKVALLIETSAAYGRGLLEGIGRFHQQKNSNWSLIIEPSGLIDRPPPWLKNWDGDGILARINDRSMANRLAKLNIPMIDLRGIAEKLNTPFVGVDNRTVSELAFQHFRNRGFRSFGVVTTPRSFHKHLNERCDIFLQLVQQAGFQCKIFRGTRFGNPALDWETQQEKIAAWLGKRSQQFPIALLCVNDLIARETIEACHRANLSVPEQVAVMGVDNDTYLCTLSSPPMTSVAVDAPSIGYKAAELLEEMMNAPQKSEYVQETLLPCQEVVVRASTDIFAIEDPEVTQALSYIRERACLNIGVDEVVATTSLCRTLLERRFAKSLNRSIYKEILRVKLDRAKALLRTTDQALSQIAEVTGFQSSVYLSQVFRRELQTTPGRWRAENAVQ